MNSRPRLPDRHAIDANGVFAEVWLEQRASLAGRRVGLTLTGGNVGADVLAEVLQGGTV